MKDLKRIGKAECKIKSVENESLVQKKYMNVHQSKN